MDLLAMSWRKRKIGIAKASWKECVLATTICLRTSNLFFPVFPPVAARSVTVYWHPHLFVKDLRQASQVNLCNQKVYGFIYWLEPFAPDGRHRFPSSGLKLNYWSNKGCEEPCKVTKHFTDAKNKECILVKYITVDTNELLPVPSVGFCGCTFFSDTQNSRHS